MIYSLWIYGIEICHTVDETLEVETNSMEDQKHYSTGYRDKNEIHSTT